MGFNRNPISRISLAEAIQVGRSTWRHRPIPGIWNRKLATPPSLSVRHLTPPTPAKQARCLHISSSAMSSTTVNRSKGEPASSWLGHHGAAAFDLRSDTMTTPTQAMLSAIQKTTLLDDVFQEDTTTTDLEAHIASLTGKEAGLFVLSGTMGNQLALRALLTQPPHSVLTDHRSHIIQYEAGGVSSLTGAMITPVIPKNGLFLTLSDIQASAILDNDVHSCPTRVISLENSLNGLITPLNEIQKIAAFAREHNILMHCDGARLWEVVAADPSKGDLKDYSACFDTLSLCFSKGLGAPIGSILVGPKPVIKHARWIRKSIGGGLRQSGVVTAAARVAIDTTFGHGPRGEGGLLRATHDTARRVAALWANLGGKLEYPVHTNMVWLDLSSLNTTSERFVELGKQAGLRIHGNRLITHYQIGEEAIRRLTGIFEKVAAEKESGDVKDVRGRRQGIYGSKL
ncbi:pyridoxal phosphate-dependent transferase [Hypoxylon trugodes]|uniref:pyridoxal phosphate-dependent transferase n=1 Tax=Hypoxylon trugodes TaxID=326681 RepID=UPI0021A1E69D|nr:pyridoxal phosphate-dependent transferase [Hypoxylon trugodes]KAI1387007.1 pyridoxal phosphate-dependent transferase [Hypoxylon trugodes]